MNLCFWCGQDKGNDHYVCEECFKILSKNADTLLEMMNAWDRGLNATLDDDLPSKVVFSTLNLSRSYNEARKEKAKRA